MLWRLTAPHCTSLPLAICRQGLPEHLQLLQAVRARVGSGPGIPELPWAVYHRSWFLFWVLRTPLPPMYTLCCTYHTLFLSSPILFCLGVAQSQGWVNDL